jgi:hypothetical protein
VFDALMPEISAIISSYTALETIKLGLSTSELGAARNVSGGRKFFFIEFVRGLDGVWRLDGM